MKNTFFLFAFISIIYFSSFAQPNKIKKPNIVMIVTHDIGRHIGCYGVETVQTPNIDRLSKDGMKFNGIYSTSSVCTPGRASLHTGRYPQSNGLLGLSHGPWWWELNSGEQHTAQILKRNGYDTYLVGLSHLGKKYNELGYDAHLSPRTQALESVDEAKRLFTEQADSEKPFFAKVGFFEVHRPFTNGSDSSKGIFVPPYLADTKVMRNDLATFQATIKFFDECVGNIMKGVQDAGIAENTIFIITSEHGIPYPGSKWAIRKAGIEIPLIIYQPGTIFSGGKEEEALISNVDILPTLLDYLGVSIPSQIEGKSFIPYLSGKSRQPPRNEIFGQYTRDMKRDNESRCVFDGRYWYIHYFSEGRSVDYPVDVDPVRFAAHLERCKTKGLRPFFQLYDVQNDPYQLNDIGGDPDNKKIVDDLSDRLLNWMKGVNDQLIDGPVSTAYYNKSIDELKNESK
jgi:N-sulfoglucosamine sulfohydrolase